MKIITTIFLFFSSLLFYTTANSTEPEVNKLHPILPTVYSWRLSQNEGLSQLEILNTNNKKALRKVDISDCMFCSGEEDNCDVGGIFAYSHQQIKEPLLAVICHVGAHSQRFELFRPMQSGTAVVSITGDFYVDFTTSPQRITVRYDRNQQEKITHWPK